MARREEDSSPEPMDKFTAQLFAVIDEMLRHEPAHRDGRLGFFITPDAWLLLISIRHTLQLN